MRQEEGVKIYFDAVSTAAREDAARDLAAQVLADTERSGCINTIGTIVWHVAARAPQTPSGQAGVLECVDRSARMRGLPCKRWRWCAVMGSQFLSLIGGLG